MYTRGRLTAVAAAVVLTAGTGVTAAAVSTPSSAHVVSMATAGRTRAGVVLTSGTSFLDISVARLDGTLLRASTPEDAPVRPELSGESPVVLSLTGDQPAPGRPQRTGYIVSIVLNSAVTWSLDLAGGTQRTDVNLRGGHVGGSP